MPVRNPTEKALPLFNELFKFQIGDLVEMRQIARGWEVDNELNPAEDEERYYSQSRLNSPPGATIVGRRLEECEGGIQAHYLVRNHPREADKAIAVAYFFEWELVPYDDLVAIQRKRLDARHVARAAKEEARKPKETK